jgi:myo-inositol 2-dehydrogenase/D-chiro-inositol 1-dehydrogenase|tara:strand:- start:429 stop:1469 length:1041 start_codon:yes stop_codon:yes gene_type:complete
MYNFFKEEKVDQFMINIALFGLGRIGLMHGQNLFLHPQFKLKYVYDIDKSLTKKISKKFNCIGINNPSIALKDKNVQSIFIATSIAAHIKFIIEAVKHKKTVFCEKPLDLNIDKINKCKKIISNLNPRIQLGFNRRHDPGHNSLKKYLDNGKIGKLEKIIITSRDPKPPPLSYLKSSGGIFKDMMIHDFDLIRFYLGADELNTIIATASNISNKRFSKIKDFELATCVLKSKKGVQCVITNSRHCSFGYDQRVELFGTKGMVISNNKREKETSIYNKSTTSMKTPLMNFFIERYKEAYKLQLNDLIKLVKKNIRPLANFEDGRRAIIIANSAEKSLKNKKIEKITF